MINPEQRAAHVLFLQGCLQAVTGEFIGPANREALQHFLEGQTAVHRGQVRSTDPTAMRAFIEDVKSGRWP